MGQSSLFQYILMGTSFDCNFKAFMTTCLSISHVHDYPYNKLYPISIIWPWPISQGHTSHFNCDMVKIQILDKIYSVVWCCYFTSHFIYVSKFIEDWCAKGYHDLDRGHRNTYCFQLEYIGFDINRWLCFVRLYLFFSSIPVENNDRIITIYILRNKCNQYFKWMALINIWWKWI